MATATNPLDAAQVLAEEEHASAGTSPWRLARRRLRRNKVALVFGALFVVLVLLVLAAPLYADHVAETTPSKNDLAGTLTIDGKQENIVSFDGIPHGPTWFSADGKYVLGADNNGRDVAVRLLYGGRNSLLIGVGAALISTILGTILGLLAGFYGRWVDTGISRFLDIQWAFPPVLLGVALGVSLSLGGLSVFGLFSISGDSLWVPTLIIGVIGVTYLARVIRGEVLSLREKEFIEAARAQGMGNGRIIVSEVLPNVASSIIVFFPLLVASSILNEAALSFLGAGVQPPNPSWGTMIGDGVKNIITAPHLTVVPGLMLVITVLSLNVFGDGVRDALDPRSKVRIDT